MFLGQGKLRHMEKMKKRIVTNKILKNSVKVFAHYRRFHKGPLIALVRAKVASCSS